MRGGVGTRAQASGVGCECPRQQLSHWPGRLPWVWSFYSWVSSLRLQVCGLLPCLGAQQPPSSELLGSGWVPAVGSATRSCRLRSDGPLPQLSGREQDIECQACGCGVDVVILLSLPGHGTWDTALFCLSSVPVSAYLSSISSVHVYVYHLCRSSYRLSISVHVCPGLSICICPCVSIISLYIICPCIYIISLDLLSACICLSKYISVCSCL